MPRQRDPGCGDEQNPVIHWFGYHLVELIGVGLPVWPALAWSPWFAAASVLVGARWGAHELKLARELGAARGRRDDTAAVVEAEQERGEVSA